MQDAFGTLGVFPAFSIDEQDALDAIGYNFVSVPEPSTLGLLGVSLLMIALFRRNTAVG